MKTLKKLTDELYNGKVEDKFIAIYEENEPLYPDYADEILDTHGDRLVKDYRIRKDGILVVLLEEEK